MNYVDPLSTVVPGVTRVLHAEARFVLCIADHGAVTVINNHFLVVKSIPLIAVTAVRMTPLGLRQVSVLEIGYQRARPYSRVHTARNRLRLERRSPSFELSESEFRLVYPEILRCLRQVLNETIARWKSSEPWWICRGRPPVERGVEITIRRDDRWLYEALMREHVRFFRDYYMRRYVKWINNKLRNSKYNQYRTYGPNVREVVQSIQRSAYFSDPALRATLLGLCRKRALIVSALRDLSGIHVMNGDPLPPWSHPDRLQPAATPLFFRMTLDQPKGGRGSHATGCARFEVFYEGSALRNATLESTDIPF